MIEEATRDGGLEGKWSLGHTGGNNSPSLAPCGHLRQCLHGQIFLLLSSVCSEGRVELRYSRPVTLPLLLPPWQRFLKQF